MGIFLADRFRYFEAYAPGEQPRDRKYVKLNTNESPFPPAPGVARALAECAETLNLYPDPTYAALRGKLAALHGVTPDMVTVGCGSDEILDFIFRAFLSDRGAVFPDVTYGFYKVLAELYGIAYREIPLRDGFAVAPSDYAPTAPSGGNPAVVLAEPNAPTGIAAGEKAITEILEADPLRPVVIDEAYADFSGVSAVPLLGKHKNLIVVRTFSKSRSLAGGRVGYCVAFPEIIRDIDLIRFSTNPYNLSRAAVAAAEASLDDDGYFKECVETVVRTRDRFAADLRAIGFDLSDSSANFVFARCPEISGKRLAAVLRERGFLVRRFDGERIKDHLRITVGSRSDMAALFSELKNIAGK